MAVECISVGFKQFNSSDFGPNPGVGVLPYSLGEGVPLGSRKSYLLLDLILQIL